MNIALDTNAYSALERGDKIVAQAVRKALVIGLPVIVLGELYFGFENGRKRQQNLEKLRHFTSTPRVEVLQLTPETARIFGEIAAELEKAGKRIQQDDIWIAALCKQHSFSLLTADKGFKNIAGLDMISF